MAMRLSALSVHDEAVQSTTFGGNFLFNRDELGDDPTQFNALADELGVDALRYPGGAVTEFMFDLENPDSTVGYDIRGDVQELVPLSEFMAYAEASGKSVTIVLPTRDFLSKAIDGNGNRFAQFDDDLIRDFVTDVVRGDYGDVQIDGFEIGNEYWGSGGMSSVEYGRLASRMAAVIDDTLDKLEDQADWVQDTDVIVQAGTNYNYSKLDDEYADLNGTQAILDQIEQDYGVSLSDDVIRDGGGISWNAINNELLIDKFDTPEELAAVDAVAHHLYTRDHDPLEEPEFALSTVDQFWESRFPDIKTYITEYNQKANTANFTEDDYGLKNAHELLNIIEEMTDHGVEQGHVWPLSQWTENALSRGFAFEKLTPTGEMFKMMNEELPGLRSVQFQGALGREAEASSANERLNVHAFASEDKLVMYFASNADQSISYDVELSNLITGGADIDVTVLGVEDSTAPGNKNASATVQERNPDQVVRDNTVEADLNPHEIMQVVIEQPEWTPQMAEFIDAGETPETTDDPFPLPVRDPLESLPPDEEEEAETDTSDDDMFEGMDILLMLLPLLALAGFG